MQHPDELFLDAKFYYRRGTAKSGLRNHEGAYADLKEAHKMLPADQAIAKRMKEVKR